MLRKSLVVLLLLAAVPLCAANPAPVNLDFESGSLGEVPPGWHSPTVQWGYTAAIVADMAKQGKQSARVSGAPKPTQSGRPAFGNLMQTIDATPYRGKRVRFRGAVRVEGAGATALLWMRADRPARQPGFFDNMQDRPIRSAEWTYYEIAGDIEDDAESLNIGVMLQQSGTAWLDDVTIEIIPKQPTRAAAPRALAPRGLENLIAFTRLLGYVRHFHPTDQVDAADWNAIAVNGVEIVEGAQSAEELVSRLQDVFLPVAPSIRIHVAGVVQPKISRPEDTTTTFAYEHRGFGEKAPDWRSIYSTKRVRAMKLRDPRILTTDLGGGVAATIPLDVYADARRTLPHPTRAMPQYPTAAYTGKDRSTRLGAVVLIWNVLQHFYPYFDVVDVDWNAELTTALRAAATDEDDRAFFFTLRRMIASIDDGHGAVVYPAAWRGRASLPILWRVVGDSLVITTVDADVTGVSAGDVVETINGKPALPMLREIDAQISGATLQWKRTQSLRELALGPTGAQSTLTIRNPDGTTRTAQLTHTPREGLLAEKRPEKIAELKPGYWYVDLDRITDADFTGAVYKLADAKGIVFDMRGYPRADRKLLGYLSGEPLHSARWNVPVSRWPNREHVEWDTSGRWTQPPLSPRLPRNVVFLTNGRAISYAETWMGIVEAYKLGTIVGEPTAGTNGNINVVHLPGDYRVVFTGMKVLKHDGSRHHGVGIVPTVPVTPTIDGIRAGRDEQLEKALEVLAR